MGAIFFNESVLPSFLAPTRHFLPIVTNVYGVFYYYYKRETFFILLSLFHNCTDYAGDCIKSVF